MDRVFPEALAPLKDADREMYDLIGHAGMCTGYTSVRTRDTGRDARLARIDGWIDRRRRAPHARARDEGRERDEDGGRERSSERWIACSRRRWRR